MKTLTASLVLLVSLGAMNLSVLQADPLPVNQPRMRDALARLQDARTALNRAERNKNGHRERAIELVNQAIAEVQAGMAQAR